MTEPTSSSAASAASDEPAPTTPATTLHRWRYGLTFGALLLIAGLGVVGFSLQSWAGQYQVEVLQRFADDFAESAELSRRDPSIAEEFRTLALRATQERLTFLEFGVLVVLHRDFLEDGLLSPEEIELQRTVIRDILAEKFDPAMVPRPRG